MRVSVTPYITNYVLWLRFLPRLAFFNRILQMDMILTNYQLSNNIWAWPSYAIHLLSVRKWEICNTPVVLLDQAWNPKKLTLLQILLLLHLMKNIFKFLTSKLLNNLKRTYVLEKNDNMSLNWEFVTLHYLLLILLQSILKLTIYRLNIELCRYILIGIIEIWHACKQKSIFFIFKENM